MIDLALIAPILGKAASDERRIGLFVSAVQKKALEMVSSPRTLQVFAQDSSQLISRWIGRARKLSFADLFRDPFKALREETRGFARKWELDPEFLREIGA